MKFQFNDGGRAEAGYKGKNAGDCVVRSIAIATNKPYQKVYDALNELADEYNMCEGGNSSSRTGLYKETIREYMTSIGAKWTPTMFIGSGCKVHLKEGELPMGRLVVNVSKHLVAVIDGVINDTFDCSRNETRCVYGYWAIDPKGETI